MNYSIKLKNELKTIYYNVINLLEDRGYSSDVLGKYISINTLDFKIHNFLDSDDGDSTLIDMYIPGEKNTYVKFFRGENIDKSVSHGTKQRFKKSIEFIKRVANLSDNDNIIFVLVDTLVGKEARKSVSEIESENPFLRIFSHRDLLFNIARHSLVPKHRLFTGSKHKLFKKLMINGNDQLPYILHSDPIARYYNFRHNDIVEVFRPTKTDGYHRVYRACIDLNSKTKDTTLVKKKVKEVKEAKMGNIDQSTITLTFSEAVENHAKNQKIGQIVERGEGFSIDDLSIIKENAEKSGFITEVFNLNNSLAALDSKVFSNITEAQVLVIRDGVNFLLEQDGDENMADLLFKEQSVLSHDKKAIMYGEVRNKHARHNLCFADFSQEPDYENGKGRIYAFSDPSISLTNSLRDNMTKLIDSEKTENLLAEGNYYYDKDICGIGFHGDLERRKVIGVRLGAAMPLIFKWYNNSKPLDNANPISISLNHGDIYIMSEKAVGTDFKKKSLYTLRHAAGCAKFTSI